MSVCVRERESENHRNNKQKNYRFIQKNHKNHHLFGHHLFIPFFLFPHLRSVCVCVDLCDLCENWSMKERE